MNRGLSKCEFIGVAAFANIYLGILLPQFAEVMCKNEILSKYTAGQTQSLKEPCTFKGKCAVNAEIFICNFIAGPFNKTIFNGRRTVLKERAYQQCIAT